MDKPQNHNEIIDKVVSGARWAAMLRLTGQAVSWLSTIIVVRFISPEDYGLNAMVEAPLELLMLLSTFGLDLALVRSKNIEQNELRSVFGWLLVINGLLFLAYFFGGSLIAAYFGEPRLELLARALAFVFLLVPFRVIPNALLDRKLKFKLRALAEFIASVSAAIATLVLAILGAGVWALVVGMLINRVLLAIILMILEPWITIPSLSFSAVRAMMAFGGMLSLGGVIVLITDKLATLIAGPILGAETLGVFAVTFEFALLPLTKVMPVINSIIFPAFSKFQEQRDVAEHYLRKSLGIVALGLFPVMIGLACIAEGFVVTVLGDKWSAVAVPLTLLSVVMPFRMTTSFLRPVLSSMGRPDLSLKSAIIALVILLPLILIGAHHGVIGLVAAMMITELIVVLSTISMSKAVLGTSFTKIGESLRPAIVCSAVMAVCVLGGKIAFGSQVSLGRLFIDIGLGALVYFATLRIFYQTLLDDGIRLFLGRGKASASLPIK
ncbi:MAG: lipopolysaccharide biosynthesis protein [Nitrosospira sp.]|nr:lipopolysaccharide biosynthesis protein [Nitrosospira sp.]MDN5881425.1 lipopolysaccharide biosynthesis protein [Nitrosospira sp.]